MANLNPINKGNYHKIKNFNINDAQWPARKFLITIAEEDLIDVTSREMMGYLGCSLSVASGKLGLLKQWNCLQITKRGKGKVPHQYNITDWGKEMAKKWAKEKSNTKE